MIATKRIAIACLVGMTVGCGNGTTTPTSPTTTTVTNETWASVLAPGGTSSRSFTANAAGTITVTMTSAGAAVGLGIGLPRTSGGGCRLGVSVTSAGSASPQITTQADAGQYCVQVFDLGTLTDPVSFTLKIDHP